LRRAAAADNRPLPALTHMPRAGSQAPGASGLKLVAPDSLAITESGLGTAAAQNPVPVTTQLRA
jgi:hypothetical protein